MWFVVFQTLFLSIFILYLVHMLIQYLQDAYTIKKTKDMFSIHVEKYEKMLDDLIQKYEK